MHTPNVEHHKYALNHINASSAHWGATSAPHQAPSSVSNHKIFVWLGFGVCFGFFAEDPERPYLFPMPSSPTRLNPPELGAHSHNWQKLLVYFSGHLNSIHKYSHLVLTHQLTLKAENSCLPFLLFCFYPSVLPPL